MFSVHFSLITTQKLAISNWIHFIENVHSMTLCDIFPFILLDIHILRECLIDSLCFQTLRLSLSDTLNLSGSELISVFGFCCFHRFGCYQIHSFVPTQCAQHSHSTGNDLFTAQQPTIFDNANSTHSALCPYCTVAIQWTNDTVPTDDGQPH